MRPAVAERTGILLVNLGTPDQPTPWALRRFLRAFLSDPRVVEAPRWLWLPILYGVILPLRPYRSARAYRKIWRDDGSPLMVYCVRLFHGIRERLNASHGDQVLVRLAMRYGKPSLRAALDDFREQGVTSVLVAPLYPQYSSSTTASVYDGVVACLQRWRVIPRVHLLDSYHLWPAYIDALAASIKERNDEPAAPVGEHHHLLVSFHGTPERYRRDGDPYRQQCEETAKAMVAAAGIADDHWTLAFQSRFGREPWLQPYTDKVLEELAGRGVYEISVICPGFSVDCLETLEEINLENRNLFLSSGGSRYHYIPCLNDTPAHVDALATLLSRHIDVMAWKI